MYFLTWNQVVVEPSSFKVQRIILVNTVSIGIE
jgi:hypothetical protein